MKKKRTFSHTFTPKPREYEMCFEVFNKILWFKFIQQTCLLNENKDHVQIIILVLITIHARVVKDCWLFRAASEIEL